MKSDPKRVEGAVHDGQTVVLDDAAYINCMFRNCQIVYRGTGPVTLDGNSFDGCQWRFEGPAAATLDFMKQLYRMGGGGRELVEATIRNLTQR